MTATDRPRVLCDHGCVMLQDSCSGCDAAEETPHTATVRTVIPSWTTRPHRRCTACQQRASARIHRAVNAPEEQQP
jgi:hypothetical protein